MLASTRVSPRNDDFFLIIVQVTKNKLNYLSDAYNQGPIKLDGGLRHSSIWGPLRPPDRWIYPVYIIWIQIYVINSIV